MSDESLPNELEENKSSEDCNNEINNINKEEIFQEIYTSHPELFNDLPLEKAKVLFNVFSSGLITSFKYQEKYLQHQGPLPDPKTLKRYNDIIENGAERIMVMAEKQQVHRMGIEKRVINSETFQSLLGQIFAFVLAIVFAIFGYSLVIKEFVEAGIAVFTVDIVGLASVFIIGKSKKDKDLKNK